MSLPDPSVGSGVVSLSREQRVIDAPAALRAAAAAVQAATVLSVQVNVAVVDAAGVLAAFVRMPGGWNLF